MLEIRRCAHDADKELSLAIYNEVVPEEAVSLEEVRKWEAARIASADFVAAVDGDPAGSVAAGIGHARPTIAHTLLTVLPPMRGRGVGTALYGTISGWARENGATELSTRIQEREPESLAFAERRGFKVVVRETRLILDLDRAEPPRSEPPQGVEIVLWAHRPELARALYELTYETNPDIPGNEDWAGQPFEVWEQIHRPELMFVAVVIGEVVGFGELFVSDARPGIATHLMLGVKRSWRGRGVARALKTAQIAWAKENGYTQMQTTNELRNEPIRRLNQRLGYREAPGRVEARGPLASAAASRASGDTA